MSEQWRTEREIARHQAADRSYLEEGAQLIELAHGVQRLFGKQEAGNSDGPTVEDRRGSNPSDVDHGRTADEPDFALP
jgi:hypothetical protein